jgi:hypothetical protein
VRIKARILRIKRHATSVEVMSAIDPGFEVPLSLPSMVLCPLPDHVDGAPSCWLREDRWHCFGCGRGGDGVDYASAYLGEEDLATVLGQVEGSLGLEGKVGWLVGAARRDRPSEDPGRRAWSKDVLEIEAEVFALLRPYLRSPDPIIFGIAWSRGSWVFHEIDLASMDDPPLTGRGRAERLRGVRRWARGWVSGVERDVFRTTGKDRLDVTATMRRGLMSGNLSG